MSSLHPPALLGGLQYFPSLDVALYFFILLYNRGEFHIHYLKIVKWVTLILLLTIGFILCMDEPFSDSISKTNLLLSSIFAPFSFFLLSLRTALMI